MATAEWWRDAVVYQIYVRSFADFTGDGVGDIAGIIERLPYIIDLGVDAIWLTPFYPSPMHDHGYDVVDHRDVDPMFGSLADFDMLLDMAHRAGIKVYVDLVPNHTSSDHPWFRAAVADPDAAERERYFFRPPKPDGSPPNDWQSVFGGPAWTLEPSGENYYLHLFDKSQPDLDWRNGIVHAEFRSILRFWFDRGVDGVRIDVAHGVMKDRQLRDGKEHAWDQDDVFKIWQEWRDISDGFAARAYVGEVFLLDMERVARYVGRDRLHQAFNFVVAKTPFDAAEIRAVLRRSLTLFGRSDTSPTWVLSNHDLTRHATRFGGGAEGVRRGLAFTALLHALPGAPYIYQGEELGLEEADVPPEARQDPVWFRSGQPGRDGARTPMPWNAAVGFGFTSGTPWLPFGPDAAAKNVVDQLADPSSTLNTYRRIIATRRELRPSLRTSVTWPDGPDDVVVAHRDAQDGVLVAVMNAGSTPATVALPGPGELVLATDVTAEVDGSKAGVPAESTVWIRCRA